MTEEDIFKEVHTGPLGAQLLADDSYIIESDKGIYKALVKTRLDDINSLGIELATSGAREKTSAPILERLGFKTAFRNEIFQYDLRKKN